MHGSKRQVKIGTEIWLDGARHVVTGWRGGSIELRSANGGGYSLMLLQALVTSPGFKLLPPKGELESEHQEEPVFEDNLPPAAKEKALLLLRHLLEATTGYRSGTEADPADDEPRRQYDPELTTLTLRLETKAAELQKTRRWIFENLARYKAKGITGLVDGRLARLGVERTDYRVRLTIGIVLDEIVDASSISRKKMARLVEKRLKAAYTDENIRFPSNTTFLKLIDDVGKGRAIFGSAKGRRNTANRPDSTYSHFIAHRPGEMVLIDSTPLDAFAIDPLTFQWVQVQLTIAYDLYTRSLVAWRFTPVSTKAVDAALLLYDLIRPKPKREGWPDTTTWAYAGVPESIIIEAYSSLPPQAKIAAIPFLHPESVIVDRGKVFLSSAFTQCCTHLGINLYVARPYTPTDKAHVERIFRSIRESFVENLPGYKGPDVYSRGANVQNEAFFFIDELEALFAEWVATYWQRREHEGLELPHVPRLKLSPNNMFEVGLATAGFVYLVPDQTTYYQLLPTAWRTIQHYGVDFNNLRYDGDALNNYRDIQSPYRGSNPGKWPIKYDPRDLSVIFFYDHDTSTWHPLEWIGEKGVRQPFSDKILSYAKALVINKGGDTQKNHAVEEELKALLNRIDDEVMVGHKERRLAALNYMQSNNAEKDRPKATTAHKSSEGTRSETTSPLNLPDFGEGEADLEKITKGIRILRTGDEILEDEDDDLAI